MATPVRQVSFLDQLDGVSAGFLHDVFDSLQKQQLQNKRLTVQQKKDVLKRYEKLAAFYQKNPYLARLKYYKNTHPEEFAKIYPEFANFESYDPLSNPAIYNTYMTGMPTEISGWEQNMKNMSDRYDFLQKMKYELGPAYQETMKRIAPELISDDAEGQTRIFDKDSYNAAKMAADDRYGLYKVTQHLSRYVTDNSNDPSNEIFNRYKQKVENILDSSISNPSTLVQPQAKQAVSEGMNMIKNAERVISNRMQQWGNMRNGTKSAKIYPYLVDVLRTYGFSAEEAENIAANPIFFNQYEQALTAVPEARRGLSPVFEHGFDPSNPDVAKAMHDFLNAYVVKPLAESGYLEDKGARIKEAQPFKDQYLGQQPGAPSAASTPVSTAPSTEAQESFNVFGTLPMSDEQLYQVLNDNGIQVSASGKFLFKDVDQSQGIPVNTTTLLGQLRQIGEIENWNQDQVKEVYKKLLGGRREVMQAQKNSPEFFNLLKKYNPADFQMMRKDLENLRSDPAKYSAYLDQMKQSWAQNGFPQDALSNFDSYLANEGMALPMDLSQQPLSTSTPQMPTKEMQATGAPQTMMEGAPGLHPSYKDLLGRLNQQGIVLRDGNLYVPQDPSIGGRDKLIDTPEDILSALGSSAKPEDKRSAQELLGLRDETEAGPAWQHPIHKEIGVHFPEKPTATAPSVPTEPEMKFEETPVQAVTPSEPPPQAQPVTSPPPPSQAAKPKSNEPKIPEG